MTSARPGPLPGPLRRLGRTAGGALKRVLTRRPRQATAARPPRLSRTYPGDFTGRLSVAYTPMPDGSPDPGEVVWTWVPFEEDHKQGKDRPVLIVGRDGKWFVGIMLTSKDHDTDTAREAQYGRHWLDIGTGDWDRERRPSEVRLDRMVRIDPRTVRREGGVLKRSVFESVARSLREVHHW